MFRKKAKASFLRRKRTKFGFKLEHIQDKNFSLTKFSFNYIILPEHLNCTSVNPRASTGKQKKKKYSCFSTLEWIGDDLDGEQKMRWSPTTGGMIYAFK